MHEMSLAEGVLQVVEETAIREMARRVKLVVPGTGWCMACSATVAMEEIFGTCPHCGSHQLQATGGTEMRVREVEIE